MIGSGVAGVVRWLGALCSLVAVYLIVLVSADPWDVVIGAVLAAGILMLFRRFVLIGVPLPVASLPWRILTFVPFAAIVTRDIAVGTWRVASVVIGLYPLRQPGIVRVPIGDRTRLGVAVSALATTLSPGSFLVDVDWQERVMLIHVLDASDPEEVREGMEHFYQRYQRHVFP